eukprot:scaffold103998_cov69-Phaeocystis_antarctica.AAC.5
MEREPPSIEAIRASSASMTTDSSVAARRVDREVAHTILILGQSERSNVGATERLRLDVLPPEADGNRKTGLARRRVSSCFDRRARCSAHHQHSGRSDRDRGRGRGPTRHGDGGVVAPPQEVGDGQRETEARASAHLERHAFGSPQRLDLRLRSLRAQVASLGKNRPRSALARSQKASHTAREYWWWRADRKGSRATAVRPRRRPDRIRQHLDGHARPRFRELGEERDERRIASPRAERCGVRAAAQDLHRRIGEDCSARSLAVHPTAVGGLRVELNDKCRGSGGEVNVDELRCVQSDVGEVELVARDRERDSVQSNRDEGLARLTPRRVALSAERPSKRPPWPVMVTSVPPDALPVVGSKLTLLEETVPSVALFSDTFTSTVLGLDIGGISHSTRPLSRRVAGWGAPSTTHTSKPVHEGVGEGVGQMMRDEGTCVAVVGETRAVEDDTDGLAARLCCVGDVTDGPAWWYDLRDVHLREVVDGEEGRVGRTDVQHGLGSLAVEQQLERPLAHV